MRILIARAGRAGLSVAIRLAGAGHDVVLIERDVVLARRAFERYGIVSFPGDATDASVLHDAEIARTDVVLAMLRRDAENLAVALLARSNGVKRVMVRMRDADYRPVYDTAGIERIMAETDVLVGSLATTIEHPAIRHSLLLGGGELIAFELVVHERATAVGRTVGEIAATKGFPASCVIAGMIDTEGEFQSPRGGTAVSAHMTLLLVARHTELGEVTKFFVEPPPPSALPATRSSRPALKGHA